MKMVLIIKRERKN